MVGQMLSAAKCSASFSSYDTLLFEHIHRSQELTQSDLSVKFHRDCIAAGGRKYLR